MEKYAVIRVQGKQYLVFEGKEFLVDRIRKTEKDQKEVEVNPEVLLTVNSGKVEIGKPGLNKANVSLKVVKEMELGDKIEIFKYKAKSRYRKHTGFRPKYTRLLAEKID